MEQSRKFSHPHQTQADDLLRWYLDLCLAERKRLFYLKDLYFCPLVLGKLPYHLFLTQVLEHVLADLCSHTSNSPWHHLSNTPNEPLRRVFHRAVLCR